MSIRTTLLFATFTLLLAACGGVPGGSLAPQTAPLLSGAEGGVSQLAHTIMVTGVGTASARPDMAEVQLGVETIESDASLALSRNTERMDAVRAVFAASGIAETDIQTINYSMWAEQIWSPEGQPTGEVRYHVLNQVNIRLHDMAQLGDVMQRALDAGANNVSGITFRVADTTALQQQARQQAIADARAKAEQLASELGVALGAVRQVSESGNGMIGGVSTMEVGVGGGGGVPISSGESIVTVQVQVVFDIGG